MIYDFIDLSADSGEPLYKQLYLSIRKAIESNGLTKGDRLVSIRALSQALGISRTTIESAYSQLCAEGYIKNSPRKGYFVQGQIIKIKEKSGLDFSYGGSSDGIQVKYDLSSKAVTVDGTGIKLWRKYLKSYLNRDYIISSYGDPQGEFTLRRALSFYSYSVRGVIATDNNIIIGAGTQSLLYIICGLLRPFGCSIAVEKNASRHFVRVFEDCGFNVIEVESDENGISLDKICANEPDFILTNPSGSPKSGGRMNMERRCELIEWAQSNNKYIIEDDYNGELVYNSRPIPALQCGCTENIIYLGSFSKLLLPSVRIGYAALPKMLNDIYQRNKSQLNQTASKIEQLALADYIRDGQLERHLRRLKKSYGEKSAIMRKAISEGLDKSGMDYKLKLLETSLSYELTIKRKLNEQPLQEALKKNSVRIIEAELGESESVIKFGFSGIAETDISTAADILISAVIGSMPER